MVTCLIPPRGARRAAACVTAGVLLGVGVGAWPFTVDDAYIAARYARHLAAGQGYAMNPGTATDGVTGPLWLLPLWIAELTGLPPLTTAKALGLVCGAAAAALACWQAARAGRVALAVCAALLAVQGQLGIWAQAGLATGLAALGLTAATCGAASGAWWTLALAAAAMPWLRPELVLPVALLIGLAPHGRRQGLVALALGLGSVALFRMWMFGNPWPLSASAKPGGLDTGMPYVAWGLFVITGGIGVALAWRGARADPWRRRCGIALILGCAAVGWAGGDWMPGFRLLVPLIPSYAWLAGVGAARLWAQRPRVTLVAVVICVLLPGLDTVVQLPDVRAAGRLRERAATALAERLRAVPGPVALVDIGFLGHASGAQVIDLAGITDPQVGRLPGGYLDKRIPHGWLAARCPAVILLHGSAPPRRDLRGRLVAFEGYPVEQRIAADPWVRAHFRVHDVVRYAPGYFYVWLEAHGDEQERCAQRGVAAASSAPKSQR